MHPAFEVLTRAAIEGRAEKKKKMDVVQYKGKKSRSTHFSILFNNNFAKRFAN